MKKTISIILTTILFMTILMPLNVLAGNGPYQNKGATDSDMALISFVDTYGNINYVYPEKLCKQGKFANAKSISYDVKTNTLTLNNFKTDEIMVVTAMGDDFKIKLSGYNELGCIISSDLSWGSSITITGKGVLYVNEEKHYTDAVYVDGSGTGKAFFKVEKTVGVRFFKGTDNAIGIYGVAEADSKKAIILQGAVSAAETKSYKYVRNIYEQENVKLADHYEGAGIFCGKTGAGNENKIFIAELSDENKNTYNVAEVVLDNELKKHIILPVKDNCKNISLKENGYVTLSEAKYPESVLVIADFSVGMNACIDENGKKCVFIDYSETEKPESDIEVYEILQHTKYGKIALLYNPKKSYKELKKVKSVTEYNHLNTSDNITINSAPKKVPSEAVIKSVKNVCGGIEIVWSAANGAEKYSLYRSQKVNGKWNGWTHLGNFKNTTYLDKNVQSGCEYKYTVISRNVLGGATFNKSGVSVKYVASPESKTTNSSKGVKVSWSNVNGATGYNIYRKQLINGKWSSWVNMGVVKPSKSYYVDKTAQSGATYRYAVRAVINKSKSSYKATSALTFLGIPKVTISNSKQAMNVKWSGVTGALNYRVYRAEYVSGKWTSWKCINKAVNATTFTDSSVISGMNYKYTVRAVNGKSLSSFTGSDNLLYIAEPIVKIANASDGINVSWSKSGGATGYIVYRKQYNAKTKKWSSWKNIGTKKAEETSWADKSVKAGVKYKYTVRAVNFKTKSSYTSTQGLVRLLIPTVKTENTTNGVNVTWNKITGAKGYIIYRAENVNGKWTGWKRICKLGNVNSYIDSTATSGTTYKYTVKAYNGASVSEYIASSAVKR